MLRTVRAFTLSNKLVQCSLKFAVFQPSYIMTSSDVNANKAFIKPSWMYSLYEFLRYALSRVLMFLPSLGNLTCSGTVVVELYRRRNTVNLKAKFIIGLPNSWYVLNVAALAKQLAVDLAVIAPTFLLLHKLISILKIMIAWSALKTTYCTAATGWTLGTRRRSYWPYLVEHSCNHQNGNFQPISELVRCIGSG